MVIEIYTASCFTLDNNRPLNKALKKFNIKYWNKKEANKVSCDGQFDLDNATITINKDLKTGSIEIKIKNVILEKTNCSDLRKVPAQA